MRRSTIIGGAAGVAVLATIVLAGSVPASAATAYDVTPAAPGTPYSVSGPLTELGGSLYFAGMLPEESVAQLWRLDPASGTAAPVASAQASGIEDVGAVVAGGGAVYAIASPMDDPTVRAVYGYDPGTDSVARFAGSGAPVTELVVAAGVPYIADTDGALGILDPADPSAPAVTPAPAACSDGGAYTAVQALTAIGAGVAFAGECAGGVAELFVYDPAAGMSVVDPVSVTPPGADIASPSRMLSFDGDLYFDAGTLADDRHFFRFDPDSDTVVEPDPTTSDPGGAFVFQGRVTWFAKDDDAAAVIVRLDGDGDSAERLPISSLGDFGTPISPVAWGDRILVNAFYSGSGGLDATDFVYDPQDGTFTRLVPTGGAFVEPFVAADGTGYILAGGEGSSTVVYRVSVAAGPAPSPSASPVSPILPATGAMPWPWLVAGLASVLAGAAFRFAPRRPPRTD